MKRCYRRPGGEISRSFNFFRDKSQTYLLHAIIITRLAKSILFFPRNIPFYFTKFIFFHKHFSYKNFFATKVKTYLLRLTKLLLFFEKFFSFNFTKLILLFHNNNSIKIFSINVSALLALRWLIWMRSRFEDYFTKNEPVATSRGSDVNAEITVREEVCSSRV